MRSIVFALLLGGALAAPLLAQEPQPQFVETISGEQLDPATYGPGYIESMATAIERNASTTPLPNDKVRQPGEQGVWLVPSRRATSYPHSAPHHIVNKWGDTRMGIGFPQPVNVAGAWLAGQAAEGAWTPGVRALGYRDGVLVQESDWFQEIGAEPRFFEMDLRDVDRIEIVALPVVAGGGWYGLDDLTYSVVAPDAATAAETIVINFDDLSYGFKLTGSDYAGLTWEVGRGDFTDEGVHGPLAPPRPAPGAAVAADTPPSRMRATPPNLLGSFQGVLRGDAGSMSYPPDTDGAIGPDHFVETVNRNFAVYRKSDGVALTNILLGAFLPGSNGDPRVLFDHHSQRWIVLVTDFSATATIFLAVSLTDDPMGDWFKTSFITAQGSDAGAWPDYPTLGVDANGIYTAAYMVGSSGGMTIFAINKAPLIANPPSLGTITAFRNLPWEGAIQPAHTYGNPGGEYLVSWASESSLRIRRVNPPLTAPTLSQLPILTVPAFSAADDAPALGSTTPLDTVDYRLMMSVFRGGSLWTAHTIRVNNRAACRWYQINLLTGSLTQWGNVADSSLHYFFPSIMVNAAGDAVMAFTGSSAGQYAGCYYTGRQASDPLGEMAPPVQYKPGTGPQNNIDSYGRNRWGDYSYTTLDPVDQTTFWTIQEYGHANNIWGTYIAKLSVQPPDCNSNGIPDDIDIANGTSADCNGNAVPDECEMVDCNGNGTLDECDLAGGGSLDCNVNGLPDECDIAAGTSDDCQPNGVPDECEIGTSEIAYEFLLSTNPGWTAQTQWAFGAPTGGGGQYGNPDPTSGHTGANVYGYNLAGDYVNNLSEKHLTSTALDCSDFATVKLSFWRWLNVEQGQYDHAYVRVSTNGSSFVDVWQNPASGDVTDNAWQYVEYDISGLAAGQPTVYLRWTMGATDGGWTYSGWNIDDIRVFGESTGGGPGDCNANEIPDACDIAGGLSQDCNTNGIPDDCDLANGTSLDVNGNGVPDECDELNGDVNCDGAVNFGDINPFVLALSNPGQFADLYPDCPLANRDINNDGVLDFADINPFVQLLSGR